MPQGHNCADGQAHVTAGADLIANHRNALFALRHQAVIMAKNLRRNLGAQFGHGGLGVFAFDFAEFKGLKFNQILQ